MDKNTKNNQDNKPQNSNYDIYNEDNLIVGSSEETVKPTFEEWFKVKICGLVKSYKIHEDGSLQVKFQEVVEKELQGIKYNEYEDKSVRIRLEGKNFTEEDAKSLLNKNVEILDVKESAQYKKIAEGQYDFTKIESYTYSSDNIKAIKGSVESNFQLYKVFELNVKDIAPAVTYNQRLRKQELDKNKTVLFYETTRDNTLTDTHKITVHGLNLNSAKNLIGKDIVVLDLEIKGSNYYCSKIKTK